MKDILIYGFGGFGHEVACLINHINQVTPTWNIIGYIDDGVAVGTECKYGKVLGGLDFLNEWKKPVDVAIAIGNPKYQKLIPSKITNPLVEFPNLIAPNVLFFDRESVKLGKGNILTFGCRMSCNIEFGDFNILNGCVTFGHDVVIGSYNLLLPESRLSGQTHVGDENYFGARCFVSQCLTVGSNNRFGAGSYILRKIKDGAFYMGNPAKKIDIE